ncbi:interleukin-17 receptor C-like isoform X2 [Osmerus eperlanus]|uniref:interleukin-17 receptor C-like isoform X2 n=1 Tax=Osmerus eperlanus TaxID=29151 RepID=UPI002E1003D6
MKSTVSWLSYSVLLAGFSTLALEMISGPQCGQVTCPPGFTCEIEDVLLLPTDPKSGSEVIDLEVVAKLCCPTKPPNRNTCLPCMLINIQLNSSDNGESGYEENFGVRDDNEDDDANVVVCFNSPEAVIPCKKINFKVTPRTAPEAQLSLVLCEPKMVQFGSEVSVTAGSELRTVEVPSVDKVCSTELQERVEACNAPNFSVKTDQVRDVVNLGVKGKNTSAFPLMMCLQHEISGICKEWKEKTIPLHSVTPCMCIQMWWEKENQRSHRHRRCPFRNNTERFQRNVWDNVSVSVARGEMNSGASMLSWNVSAPCRLEAEVWPCQRGAGAGGCREQSNSRQNLVDGPWMEKRTGFWQVQGAFEHVEPSADLCMMVKIQGMDQNILSCPNAETSRWRMSLLVLVTVLLIGIAVLGVCFLHSTVKRWAWKGLHKEWRAGRKGHMVLLSPPDAEGAVSEQVCELGSLLVAQGFRVSVDLWSRAQLGSLGPLPWLHSQLHLLDTQGGRVLVVLNRSAWEKAQQWGLDPLRQGLIAQGEDPQAGGRGDMDRDHSGVQGSSPYKDVFSACLSCIQADHQRGGAGERFTLVTFESHPARPSTGSQRGLPELLQGLPWFHLPSQRQGLLSALSGGRREVSWRWTEGLKGGLSSVWPTGL